MKVAVLMSSYNGEKYIREQINSIFTQKGQFEIDLWVRDDGSVDQTQNILQEYANRGLLNWYTDKNLKPARSFMDLLQRCGIYDFYAFADQDDFWMPDKLEKGIDALQNSEIPALYCANAELVGSSLESLGRNVYRQIPKIDFFTLCCAGGLLGCTMIFNRELARIILEKQLPEQMVMHDFYVAIVCAAMNGKIVFDETAHMKYRQHNENVVGVPHGIWKTIYARISDIRYKEPVSIAVQSKEVLERYGDELSKDKKAWLEKISTYKNSVFARMSLSCSLKTKYINKNMSLKIRLSILLGNR